MKEKVKTLWKHCFNDSNDFIEMYFHTRFSKQTNMSIESGGDLISALQLIPYPMTFCGQEVSTSYISGACTHPDFQGKGIMKELISQSLARMYSEGIYFSTLIPAEPWLFDYYSKLGYASVFKYTKKEFAIPEFIPSKDYTIKNTSEYSIELFKYLNENIKKRPCCIQHTKKDFKIILQDLLISNGEIFYAMKKKEITGIAILYKTTENIRIEELIANNKEIENSLLHAIKKETGKDKVIINSPIEDDRYPLIPMGMGRIVNVKSVLQLYASFFPKDEMQIQLTDNQLSSNNGYYYLFNGKCMFCENRLPGAHVQLNINQLTIKILGKLKPYMNLMLN